MILNEIQQKAFDLWLNGENVFITGSGGKGKSVIVEKIVEASKGSCVCVAPTAIAGLNIQAATIHSQFKFPLGYLYASRRENVADKVMDLFGDKSVRTLIIDEISMVRSDTFVAMDLALKKARRSRKPFGGIQVVVVGDFFQLPPVINANNSEGELFFKEFKSEFCFTTQAWQDAGFTMVELEKVMRQDNEKMIGFLESIRQKDSNYIEAISYFNEVGSQTDNIKNPVILCTTNALAATYNNHFYDEIKEDEKTYYARNDNYTDQDPVPAELKLKKGCKVMCRLNTESMINGQTGIVDNLTNDNVFVKLDDGSIVCLERAKWQQIEYSIVDGVVTPRIVGTYTQFPLMLGYATTIHKSQGLTLPEVGLELGRGCFASGQLYVALSRCKTPEGLGILGNNISRRDVIVNKDIIDFYKKERTRVLDL